MKGDCKEMERWRVKFAVEGRMAFLSHLDMLTAWERAMRRADFPVLLSEGFNTHMLISFGPAHAVGMKSVADYFDIDMADGLDKNKWQSLNGLLPRGLFVLEARIIPRNTKPLMAVINIAAYEAELDYSSIDGGEREAVVNNHIKEFLLLDECLVERVSPKGRKLFDIRSGVKKLSYLYEGLYMEVSVGQDGNVRPAEVVNKVFQDIPILSCRRTGLFIDDTDGRRETP